MLDRRGIEKHPNTKAFLNSAKIFGMDQTQFRLSAYICLQCNGVFGTKLRTLTFWNFQKKFDIFHTTDEPNEEADEPNEGKQAKFIKMKLSRNIWRILNYIKNQLWAFRLSKEWQSNISRTAYTIKLDLTGSVVVDFEGEAFRKHLGWVSIKRKNYTNAGFQKEYL